MSARSKARKEALDLLFEADLRGVTPQQILDQRAQRSERALRDYALRLIEGVWAHRSRIDDLIATYSAGWDVDRMPAVDRNLVRIAIYEILYEEQTPVPVAIDEAVESAKALSTEESATFINGLLGQLSSLRGTA